jgi:hypothetical protein
VVLIAVPMGGIDVPDVLAHGRRVLDATGSLLMVVPGHGMPGNGASRWDASTLAATAVDILGPDVVVEAFGNEATAGAVRRGTPAVRLGVQVDIHDPSTPVLLGLSARPTSGEKPEPVTDGH